MSALLQLLYAAVRRVGVIDVTRLFHLSAQAEAQPSISSDYTIRPVGASELQTLLQEQRIDSCVGDPDTLNDPTRKLVAAFQRDRAVSFLWMASGTIQGQDNYSRSSHLGTSIDLPDGTAFLYNAWTCPDHRGNRLAAALLNWAISHRVAGAHACLTMIDWTNDRSIRAFQFLGMQPIGWVVRIGFGRLQFSIVPTRAKQLGLQVADEAPGMKLAW